MPDVPYGPRQALVGAAAALLLVGPASATAQGTAAQGTAAQGTAAQGTAARPLTFAEVAQRHASAITARQERARAATELTRAIDLPANPAVVAQDSLGGLAIAATGATDADATIAIAKAAKAADRRPELRTLDA